MLRSGAPWRDLPERYGPHTAIYNRFNRWRKAGVWDRIMDAIVDAYGGEVEMIDTSSVRVHQHAANTTRSYEADGRRGGSGFSVSGNFGQERRRPDEDRNRALHIRQP